VLWCNRNRREAFEVAYDRDNIFAKILRDEIPSDRVYEDEEFIAFRDIGAQAPTHLLLIPRGEAPTSTDELTDEDAGWLGRLLVVATRIARDQGLADEGYRLVINCGEHAGQTVPHLHLHIVGGAPLGAFGT
jgi:histidine triad (HIT) family protein